MWQPIETAPKDGRVILLYDPEYKEIAMARYMPSEQKPGDYGDFVWKQRDGETIAEKVPSHWAPVPAPPVSNGEQP